MKSHLAGGFAAPDGRRGIPGGGLMLEARDLTKEYAGPAGALQILSGVTLCMRAGESAAIVGSRVPRSPDSRSIFPCPGEWCLPLPPGPYDGAVTGEDNWVVIDSEAILSGFIQMRMAWSGTPMICAWPAPGTRLSASST